MERLLKSIMTIREIKFRMDDDYVDRLNRQYTVIILMISSDFDEDLRDVIMTSSSSYSSERWSPRSSSSAAQSRAGVPPSSRPATASTPTPSVGSATPTTCRWRRRSPRNGWPSRTSRLTSATTSGCLSSCSSSPSSRSCRVCSGGSSTDVPVSTWRPSWMLRASALRRRTSKFERRF